jgi:hypothetical protein
MDNAILQERTIFCVEASTISLTCRRLTPSGFSQNTLTFLLKNTMPSHDGDGLEPSNTQHRAKQSQSIFDNREMLG